MNFWTDFSFGAGVIEIPLWLTVTCGVGAIIMLVLIFSARNRD